MQEDKKIETQVVDNKLKTITTTTIINVVENSVDLDYLYAQRDEIAKQKQQQTESYQAQMLTRDKEIAEIEQMISECRKAGLKTSNEIAIEVAEAQRIEDERIENERLENEKIEKAAEAERLEKENAEKLRLEEQNMVKETDPLDEANTDTDTK